MTGPERHTKVFSTVTLGRVFSGLLEIAEYFSFFMLVIF